MDSDLQKRPTAETIHNKLSEWHSFVKESDELDESDEIDELDKYDKRNEFNESNESNEKSKIVSEFMTADTRISELSTILKKHPDIVYASALIDTHDIAQQYKERKNQHNKYDICDQNKKRKNQPDIYDSASIISVENPVVNHRSKRQKPDQESYTTFN
ncbi:hypothetical protein C2G38_1063633 [Gigaspora rosea]|uniref:Uncharacterized protein n=1 Tax=Gigaspora rosea TaxID=44941 RepID=A0A397VH24_9GLOM|nr:hypothetical protein C2G38_1063633 [Gigaspora rosea]